jgi:hypothetical protein
MVDMLSIDSHFFNAAVLRNGRQLTIGDIITAKVINVSSERALLDINGARITAIAPEIALTPSQQLILKLVNVDEGGRLVLKLLENLESMGIPKELNARDFLSSPIFNTELTIPKAPASIDGGHQRAVKSSMDSTNIQRGSNPLMNEVSFKLCSFAEQRDFSIGNLIEMLLSELETAKDTGLDGDDMKEIFGIKLAPEGNLQHNLKAEYLLHILKSINSLGQNRNAGSFDRIKNILTDILINGLAQRAAGLADQDGTLICYFQVPVFNNSRCNTCKVKVYRDQKKTYAKQHDSYRVEISADTQSLGQVDAVLSLEKQVLNIEVTAVSDKAIASLTEFSEMLRQGLMDAGLKVGSINIRRGAPKPGWLPGFNEMFTFEKLDIRI